MVDKHTRQQTRTQALVVQRQIGLCLKNIAFPSTRRHCPKWSRAQVFTPLLSPGALTGYGGVVLVDLDLITYHTPFPHHTALEHDTRPTSIQPQIFYIYLFIWLLIKMESNCMSAQWNQRPGYITLTLTQTLLVEIKLPPLYKRLHAYMNILQLSATIFFFFVRLSPLTFQSRGSGEIIGYHMAFHILIIGCTKSRY